MGSNLFSTTSDTGSSSLRKSENSKENNFLESYAELMDIETGRVYSLVKPTEFIGRSPSALIVLKEIVVSRTHCSFFRNPNNSCTMVSQGIIGTLLNSSPCLPNARIDLKSGDIIKITEHSFLFKYKNHPEQVEPVKNNTLELLEERRNVFEECQNLEKEKMNRLYENLIEERERSLQDYRKNLSRYSTQKSDSIASKVAEKEKDNLIKEMERKVEAFKKKEEEWEIQKKDLEARLLQQRIEFEEKLKLEIITKADSHEENVIGLKRTADHLKNELESTQKIKKELEEENDDVKKQLAVKESALKEREKMMEFVGRDLECGVCSELCVEPMQLNCGHQFCKYCITEWKKKKKECPMCRTKIKTEMRNWTFDGIVSKLVKLLPEQEQKQRELLINQRKGLHLPEGKTPSTFDPEAPSTSARGSGATRPARSRRSRRVNQARELPGNNLELFNWPEPTRINVPPANYLPPLEAPRFRNLSDSVVILESGMDLTNPRPVLSVDLTNMTAVDLTRANRIEVDLTEADSSVVEVGRNRSPAVVQIDLTSPSSAPSSSSSS